MIDVKNLLTILRMTHDDCKVHLQIKDNILHFKAENPSNRFNFNFNLSLQQLDSTDDVHVTEPTTSQIKMPSKDFQRICQNLSSISDKMKLQVEPGIVQFQV